MNRTLRIALAALLATSTLAISVSDANAMSRKRYCQAYARRAASHVQGDHIAGGAALGAVGGGIAGAVAGDNARKETYWQAYHDCLGY